MQGGRGIRLFLVGLVALAITVLVIKGEHYSERHNLASNASYYPDPTPAPSSPPHLRGGGRARPGH